MSQIKLHVPLSSYEFLELDFEGSVEEAIEETIKIKKLYEIKQSDEPGLSVKDFSRVKRELMVNNSISMDDMDKMNRIQKWCVHEIEKTIQQIKQ